MATIYKLETLSLQAVRLNCILTNYDIIPAILHDKRQLVDSVNGHFESIDNIDIISHIAIDYNGEVAMFSFKIYGNVYKITMVEDKPMLLNRQLLYSHGMAPESQMALKISKSESKHSVSISSEDLQWKWELKMVFEECIQNPKTLRLQGKSRRKMMFKNKVWIGNCKESISMFVSL